MNVDINETVETLKDMQVHLKYMGEEYFSSIIRKTIKFVEQQEVEIKRLKKRVGED